MEREPGYTPVPRNLQFRIGLLLGLTLFIAIGFFLYVLYARGVFETTQRLTLVAENSEGVGVGAALTFSGFPIGRVRRISLAEDGRARIEIEVPRDQARWLRTTSVFTLERGFVGGARLRAYSGDLKDPPLQDGAVRQILRGDTTEEIPRMVATLRSILENLEQLTGSGGSLQANLASMRTLTERMAGKHGVLGGVLGSDDDARKVIASIDRVNALLASLGAASLKLDAVLAKTDQRVFGEAGIMSETQQAVAQARTLLDEVHGSLKKVDTILADAQAVSSSARAATTDLARLRAEVDESVRRVGHLIEEINRKWPFKRDTEIRLP